MSWPSSAAIASRRQRQVQRVLYVTLGLNSLVFAIKLTLGLATGSLSLVADALHSVTDSASNLLALVAVHFSSPEPDEEHPYGRSKFEAIGALGIAALLAIWLASRSSAQRWDGFSSPCLPSSRSTG
ncbi:cation diffusion facilitator family transporter [Synechococcus sp. W65.1]|uniref:cation diffusion facilitator family transporter n=1 Tax=Synechococcus sp. W65.1 TaxID=2964526 RepID=UPI0039C2EA52